MRLSWKIPTPSGCIWKSSHLCKVIRLEKKKKILLPLRYTLTSPHICSENLYVLLLNMIIFVLILDKLFSHWRYLLLTFVSTSSSQISSPLLHQYLSYPLGFPSRSLFSPFPSLTPVLLPSVPPPLPSSSHGPLSRSVPVYTQLLMIRTAHKILTQPKPTCACLCLGMSLFLERRSRSHAMHSSSWCQ